MRRGLSITGLLVCTAVCALLGCAEAAEPSQNLNQGQFSVVPPGGMAGTGAAPAAGAGGMGLGAAGMAGGSAGMIATGGTAGTTGVAGSAGAAGTAAMAGSGGAAGSGGMMAEAGTGGTGVMPPVGGKEPRIPPMPASCPMIRAGGMSEIMVKGQSVTIWAGPADKKGPMVFYWHGTGSRAGEAVGGLGPGLDDVMRNGGVVASFTTSTGTGTNTGNNVWYTGDFEMADEIFACAHAQGLVDPRRVYTAGCSAGGLQASAMVYGRSSYLAAAMPNSGGIFRSYPLEDPNHVPPVMAAHGRMGADVVFIDFAQTTGQQCMDISSKGGFMLDCDHGGGHCASPSNLKAAQWQFLLDHPFGVEPEPYLPEPPSGVPDYCTVCN